MCGSHVVNIEREALKGWSSELFNSKSIFLYQNWCARIEAKRARWRRSVFFFLYLLEFSNKSTAVWTISDLRHLKRNEERIWEEGNLATLFLKIKIHFEKLKVRGFHRVSFTNFFLIFNNNKKKVLFYFFIILTFRVDVCVNLFPPYSTSYYADHSLKKNKTMLKTNCRPNKFLSLTHPQCVCVCV